MLPGVISTLVTKETMIVLAWWHGQKMDNTHRRQNRVTMGNLAKAETWIQR